MHDDVTSVHSIGGISIAFLVALELHEGLALSLHFSILAMDELARELKDEVP